MRNAITRPLLGVVLTISWLIESGDAATKPVEPLAKGLRCHGCEMVASQITKSLKDIAQQAKDGKDSSYLIGGRMQKNAKKTRKREYYGSEVMAMEVLDPVCDTLRHQGSELLSAALAKGADASYKEVINTPRVALICVISSAGRFRL